MKFLIAVLFACLALSMAASYGAKEDSYGSDNSYASGKVDEEEDFGLKESSSSVSGGSVSGGSVSGGSVSVVSSETVAVGPIVLQEINTEEITAQVNLVEESLAKFRLNITEEETRWENLTVEAKHVDLEILQDMEGNNVTIDTEIKDDYCDTKFGTDFMFSLSKFLKGSITFQTTASSNKEIIYNIKNLFGYVEKLNENQLVFIENLRKLDLFRWEFEEKISNLLSLNEAMWKVFTQTFSDIQILVQNQEILRAKLSGLKLPAAASSAAGSSSSSSSFSAASSSASSASHSTGLQGKFGGRGASARGSSRGHAMKQASGSY